MCGECLWLHYLGLVDGVHYQIMVVYVLFSKENFMPVIV
jgi:hypothetical protein